MVKVGILFIVIKNSNEFYQANKIIIIQIVTKLKPIIAKWLS